MEDSGTSRRGRASLLEKGPTPLSLSRDVDLVKSVPQPVCTENLIRVDGVRELAILAV